MSNPSRLHVHVSASWRSTILLAAVLGLGTAHAQAPAAPSGEVKGSTYVHTPESALGVVQTAAVVLPRAVTGGDPFVGTWRDAPQPSGVRVPVVVFLHGSSGLGLAAIGEWQRWLATLGIASVAPNSFALPDRITYKSPVDKGIYEKVHALRQSEIGLAVNALRNAPWADTSRMILAGTSEGATSVARYDGKDFLGRVLYSWSCENNYFVAQHGTSLPKDQPVLNVMSSTDNFFSASNPWLGNSQPVGHCGPALRDNKVSAVVLIPGAPHTLLNLPPARHATQGFMLDVLKP